MLKTSDFDYDLPGELIAQQPMIPRDRSRLMVLDRAVGARSHHVFRELPRLLRAGDMLVLNDTYVIPAKFHCRRRTGGRIEGLFLRELVAGRWEVMLKGAGRCKALEELTFTKDPCLIAKLEKNLGEGLWHIAVSPAGGAIELLERVGETPLPPYIRGTWHGRLGHDFFTSRAGRPCHEDRSAYQTVYARRPGAVAAPTAGLHFTENVLAELQSNRIDVTTVTLHVSYGTFAPVKTERIEQHTMHAEWFELPAPAAEAIAAAKRQGQRIVAVGTTAVRVLETAAAAGPITPRAGWTDLFVYPPAEFRLTDALLTNFHLPRSTLLMLVAAFCSPGSTDGIKTILDAYAEAISQKYRFYSYGDAMLIL